jgi:hypothetical protein
MGRVGAMGKNKIEVLFWSIAFPGFGQLLNKQLIKGLFFIGLEILINVQANFNQVIILSFNGEIREAIHQTNYEWLMFYPCLYFFAMWDAYKDADSTKSPYSFYPFVFAAYFGTIGLIYSSRLTILGVLFGPFWLSMLFFIPGLGIGLLIRGLLIKNIKTNE